MAAVDSFQLLYREISRSCSSYFETLALVGALYTASRAIVLLSDCCTLVRVHFLPRMIPNRKLTQRYGDWAVIYGKNGRASKSYCLRRTFKIKYTTLWVILTTNQMPKIESHSK